MEKPKELNVYVVAEGDVFTLGNCPDVLNQDNWLSDWVFVGAHSAPEALAVARVVDEMSNKRKGRIYTKMLNQREIRNRLLGADSLSPSEIHQSQGRLHLQFNQGWVKIQCPA